LTQYDEPIQDRSERLYLDDVAEIQKVAGGRLSDGCVLWFLVKVAGDGFGYGFW